MSNMKNSSKVKKKPKIAVVIGTRAQLVKTGPVMVELQRRDIPYEFVYTNQHKDTFDDIRKNFGIKSPDKMFFTNQSETKTMGKIWGWFLKAMFRIFTSPKSLLSTSRGIVIVHGDTNSAWMGALLGKLRRNKVMHLESGLRSFNIFKPFPEEINRLITFQLADVYAAPNKWALNNLKRYKGVKLDTRNNTQYDAMKIALRHKDELPDIIYGEKYAVAALHRYESVFRKDKLTRLVEIVEEIANEMKVVFILYPVTEKRLIKYGLLSRLEENPNIRLQERLPFFEFIKLQYESEFVCADGGSIQEELSYMGKPTLILRDVTERVEGLGRTTVLSKFDPNVISDFIKNYKKYEKPPLKEDNYPSKIVVDWLEENGYAG